mmetsp:Transcript_26130/g.51299  ORF Transcript_26130/g.51299 Transcript_26130/m.51299 type:complete len:86 (-) Transcript_26130:5813-6070(-)
MHVCLVGGRQRNQLSVYFLTRERERERVRTKSTGRANEQDAMGVRLKAGGTEGKGRNGKEEIRSEAGKKVATADRTCNERTHSSN